MMHISTPLGVQPWKIVPDPVPIGNRDFFKRHEIENMKLLWHHPRRMDRLPDCWVHRRVFVDLDRPHVTGPHSVRTRAAELGIPRSP